MVVVEFAADSVGAPDDRSGTLALACHVVRCREDGRVPARRVKVRATAIVVVHRWAAEATPVESKDNAAKDTQRNADNMNVDTAVALMVLRNHLSGAGTIRARTAALLFVVRAHISGGGCCCIRRNLFPVLLV